MDDVVALMLERFDAAYGGRLDDQLGEWEEILRPILEEVWHEGYATRAADQARNIE